LLERGPAEHSAILCSTRFFRSAQACSSPIAGHGFQSFELLFCEIDSEEAHCDPSAENASHYHLYRFASRWGPEVCRFHHYSGWRSLMAAASVPSSR
jgi:hypothetical protein